MTLTTGQLIRRAREAAGLSEAKLGKRLGVVASAVHGWEHDRRNVTVPRLLEVAGALGVPPETLLPTAERTATMREARAHLAAASHILRQLEKGSGQ
jgi:transcriptional regulator with XRE-family HTH domain